MLVNRVEGPSHSSSVAKGTRISGAPAKRSGWTSARSRALPRVGSAKKSRTTRSLSRWKAAVGSPAANRCRAARPTWPEPARKSAAVVCNRRSRAGWRRMELSLEDFLDQLVVPVGARPAVQDRNEHVCPVQQLQEGVRPRPHRAVQAGTDSSSRTEVANMNSTTSGGWR